MPFLIFGKIQKNGSNYIYIIVTTINRDEWKGRRKEKKLEYKELSKAGGQEWLFIERFRATVEDSFTARTQKPNWDEMTYKFNREDYRQDLGDGIITLTNYRSDGRKRLLEGEKSYCYGKQQNK